MNKHEDFRQNDPAFPKHLKNQRGQVSIMVALMTMVLVTFTALSVDIGHVMIVRNQLQNAADATALSGAAYLYPAVAGVPNWSQAQTQATSYLPKNSVEKVALSQGTVITGYWNMTSATLKSTNSTPGTGDVPAVKVTVSKSAGNNGGAVKLYFGSVFGYSTVNLSATAVAVVGSPSTVNAGDLFPIAMAQGTYNSYWDSTTNSPKINPLTGQPYIFNINSGPQGGWSTFLQQVNDSPSIINLLTNGNPTPLQIGQNVWLSTGVKADVYSHVAVNVNVIVAVVANSSPGTMQPIVAFAALHIILALGGSSKIVEVQFTNNLKIPDGIPGGPNYGVYTPPTLAK